MLNIQPCLAFGLFAVTVVLLLNRPAARSYPTGVGKQFALITFQKKVPRAVKLTVWVSEPYFDVQYYHFVSNRRTSSTAVRFGHAFDLRLGEGRVSFILPEPPASASA